MDKVNTKDILGLDGCKNIDQFIKKQICRLKCTDESFSALFDVMFSVHDNVLFEYTDGNKISSITYGETLDTIKRVATNLKQSITLPHNSIVGIYMDNKVEWIHIFWATLMAGYRPLLLNKRVDKDQLTNLLKQHNVKVIISDENQLSIGTMHYSELTSNLDTIDNNFVWANEIILMTSGTSLNCKLCVYTGKNLCHQIYNTQQIAKQSRLIKRHYNGKIKVLTFLPFYHVFGLVACYMWFALFSRTFVLLNDLSGETILNTIKKHHVTHLFAVPLLWEKIEKIAKKKIADKGPKTEKKFYKGIKLSNKLQNWWPALGRWFARKAFKELRDGAFGDSIQFLISGGGAISSSTLEMMNGVGYRLANGYGMTEVGIASVELSNKTKWLNSCSVGKPFSSIDYKIDNGQLLVRGHSLASKIITADKTIVNSSTEWFNTGDMAEQRNGHYYILGRADDLVIGADGENLSPDQIESQLKLRDAQLVLLSIKQDTPKTILIVHINKYFSQSKVLEIKKELFDRLSETNIGKSIDEIYYTHDYLMADNEIKVSRKGLVKRIERNELILKDIKDIEINNELTINNELQQEVAAIFESVLDRMLNNSDYSSNFFYELGGDSLLYFSIVESIKTKYGVNLPLDEESIVSVNGICSYIQDKIN